MLLVEDSRGDAELTMKALSRRKITDSVEWVKSGREAMDFLLCRGKYLGRARTAPRLVVADLEVHDMDGFGLLEQIRSYHRFKCLPVVLLSSSQTQLDVQTAYVAGANSYLVKPVDYKAFSDLIGAMGAYWLNRNMTCSGVCTKAQPLAA